MVVSSSATTPRVALARVVVVSSDGLVSYRWVATSGAKTAEKSAGQRRHSNPNLIKQLQFSPNLHIQLVFFAGNKRSFFFLFFARFLGMEHLML